MTTTEILRVRLETSLGRKVRSSAPAWTPPGPYDFQQNLAVLAFDASLGNTGWALLMWVTGELLLLGKGTIRPKTSLDGYLGTWDKAARLRRELELMPTRYAAMPDLVALEAPMVAGGHRTESSLIAGEQVWHWANPDRLRVIGATHVSSVILGDARTASDGRKAKIREAVERYIPGSAARTWGNEHERDAVSIALTCLWDQLHG